MSRHSQVVQYVLVKKRGPITGMLDKTGTFCLTIALTIVILPLPVIVCARKSETAVESMLIAVPEITWFAFRLIAAKACRTERSIEAAMATRIPMTIARVKLKPGMA